MSRTHDDMAIYVWGLERRIALSPPVSDKSVPPALFPFLGLRSKTSVLDSQSHLLTTSGLVYDGISYSDSRHAGSLCSGHPFVLA